MIISAEVWNHGTSGLTVEFPGWEVLFVLAVKNHFFALPVTG